MGLNRALRYVWPVFWLNSFFDRYTGGSNRPAFFDIESTFPVLDILTRNQALIRRELDSILAVKESIPSYHEVDFIQTAISGRIDRDKSWKVLMLYAMGVRPAENRSLCPQTCALLEQIPDLFQAFFSILDAGKSIPEHTGPYRGYLRYHLGLKVPSRNPPALCVKDQWHVWQEGKAILFDDTYPHEVVNHADEDRVVLVVDVLRPLPRVADNLNRAITQSARYIYGRGILGISPTIARFSKMFRTELERSPMWKNIRFYASRVTRRN